MLFGLRNTTHTFQCFILRGLHFTYAYIDDVLIVSSNAEDYRKHLKMVFECLQDYSVIINPCSQECFDIPELDFLGYHVDNKGILPLENNVQVIRDYPQPTTQCKRREFFGLFCGDTTVNSEGLNVFSVCFSIQIFFKYAS